MVASLRATKREALVSGLAFASSATLQMNGESSYAYTSTPSQQMQSIEETELGRTGEVRSSWAWEKPKGAEHCSDYLTPSIVTSHSPERCNAAARVKFFLSLHCFLCKRSDLELRCNYALIMKNENGLNPDMLDFCNAGLRVCAGGIGAPLPVPLYLPLWLSALLSDSWCYSPTGTIPVFFNSDCSQLCSCEIGFCSPLQKRVSIQD